MELKRVVVTGLGALTPVGLSVPDFWQNVLAGSNGVCAITRFNTENYKTKFACELKNFDINAYVDAKEARKLSGSAQYAIGAAQEAVRDARLLDEGINPDRVGIVVGSGIGGAATTVNDLKDFSFDGGVPRFSPFFILKTLSNMIVGTLSIRYGFRGPSYVTTSACASAANAMMDACHFIQLGKADIMLTGGSEAAIEPVGIGGFNAMRALSTRNDDMFTASRPFSVGRDGFVMGEGAGILVLEELEHALRRNATIYAELLSVGQTSDAYHVTSPCPDGAGASAAMHHALVDAGVQPEDIDYVNMHGTSTPQGDLAECRAVETIFGAHTSKMVFNSTKSMIGHMLGAGAAVESIVTILSLKNGITHPTINLQERDPEIPDWNFCAHGPVKAPFRYALCNAFGFGGHNASILFRKFEK